MSESVERLLIRIDATAEQLRRELKVADTSVGSFQRKVDKNLRKIKRSITQVEHSFGGLKSAVAGLGAALAVREIIQASDSMAKYRGQLGLVTDSQEELNATYAKTLKLANETGQSTEATVNLYARLARATESLGISQEEVLGLTKSINQSFVISGATSQEAASAALQLSQAFAKGTLDGQELKAVMESSPRLAKAIADGMGIAVGALKDYGSEGKLNAGVVAEALRKNADIINEEFQSMPMTIGRVWQTLSNDINDALGQVDAGPLIASVEELRSVISDPAFSQTITSLSQALLDLVASSASALSGLTSLSQYIAEDFAAAIHGAAAGDMARLEEELAGIEKRLNSSVFVFLATEERLEGMRKRAAALTALIAQANPLNEEYASTVDDVGDSAETAAKSTNKVVKSTADYTKELKAVEKELVKLEKRHKKANKALSDGVDAIDEMVKSTEDYIEELEFEYSLLGKTERAQALLTAEREHGSRATEDQKQRIATLTATLYDAKAATDAAAAAQKPFQDALQGTAERIDSAFADAWRGAFDSFSDFSDGIKDAFKNLLAELAHMAITRPILLSFAGAMGFGGSTAASAAGGAASSLLPAGVSGFFGDAGKFLGGPYWENTLTPAVPGDGGAALGPQFNWANAGAAFGGSVAGSYLGNQVYGKTSGLGQTAGGLGGAALGAQYGAALGPWGVAGGALLGSFGGGFVESLFGGKNNGNNSGYSNFNLATGAIDGGGVGKSFNQENVDAAAALVQPLQDLATALGGSDLAANITVSDNGGIKFGGTQYGSDTEAFYQAAFKEVIKNAKLLDAKLKPLISAFKGTAEEIASFALAITSLNTQIKDNPVGLAVEDFALAQEAAARTLTDTYQAQIQSINEMALMFDGSAQAATNLNTALSINRDLAYQMATAIQTIGVSIDKTVRDSVGYFKESVRTPDESLANMQKQLEFFFAVLPTLADPAQIEAVSRGLIDMNQAIFDAGPDDLQRSNVDTYIDFAQAVGQATQEALLNTGLGLAGSQESINANIQTMLDNSAAKFQDSADTMQGAAELMFTAVQQFANGQQYSEVVA